jgi:hypothetical protein
MKLLAASIVLGLLLTPAVGAAQTCALLTPGAPAEGPPASADVVQAAFAAVTQALAADGIHVIAADDAQRRMTGQPFERCNALECGGAVVQSLGVDFAVLITIWAPRGQPTTAVVTLITQSDSAAGDAPVEDGDVVRATLAALATARQRFESSQMGYVDVRSVPPGAVVEVDGRSIGTTPVRRMVPSGARALRVTLEGHRTHEETVQVGATEERVLEITLEPGADVIETPPASGATYSEPHFANWLIGGALIAGGIAALVSPLWSAAVDGQCIAETDDGAFCTSVGHFGVQSGVLLGVGGAAILGGAIFMIAQPITMTTSVSPTSAYVELRGAF